MQFSLFDISDPALPRRIDKQTYGEGAAEAEFDPKAFLYWQPRNLIIAPTHLVGDPKLVGGFKGGRTPSAAEREGAFSGVMLLRATTHGLTELGHLAIADADGSVNRSLVIGDTVYLLSDHALRANSLDTHRRTDKLSF